MMKAAYADNSAQDRREGFERGIDLSAFIVEYEIARAESFNFANPAVRKWIVAALDRVRELIEQQKRGA